jgi:hypothetical protein
VTGHMRKRKYLEKQPVLCYLHDLIFTFFSGDVLKSLI